MTPTADRLQTEKRRRDTIASDRELVIAGKKQRTRIQSHADEHPWPTLTRSSPELQRSAILTCAQRVDDSKLPPTELHDILDKLGLTAVSRTHPTDEQHRQMQHPCDTCNAQPGHWCRTKQGGWTEYLHQCRWDPAAVIR